MHSGLLKKPGDVALKRGLRTWGMVFGRLWAQWLGDSGSGKCAEAACLCGLARVGVCRPLGAIITRVLVKIQRFAPIEK